MVRWNPKMKARTISLSTAAITEEDIERSLSKQFKLRVQATLKMIRIDWMFNESMKQNNNGFNDFMSVLANTGQEQLFDTDFVRALEMHF